MADANDVLQTARDAFEDAHVHRDQDLADARTPEQARAVTDNHDAALANYLDALRAAFSLSNPAWEEALADAHAAKKAVDDARAADVKFVARLSALSALTTAIGTLIGAAK